MEHLTISEGGQFWVRIVVRAEEAEEMLGTWLCEVSLYLRNEGSPPKDLVDRSTMSDFESAELALQHGKILGKRMVTGV